MDKPFTLFVFATIIGILLSYYFKTDIVIIFLLIVFFVISFIYNINKKRSNNLIIFILFLLIGLMTTSLNKNSKLIAMVDIRRDYTGMVHHVIKADSTEGKYIVLIKNVDNAHIANEKIMLKVLGNKVLKLGDSIKFNGVLRLPMENTNPMLFNYRLSLLSEKIYTIMTIKDYSIIESNNLNLIRYQIKDRFIGDVKNLFNEHLNQENSNLITSIILGESSYLEEESLLKYRNLGLAHILAVSGLHIGIISGFLLFLFSRLGLKKKYNFLLTLSIIWFYGYLIGYSPSTLRASLMFSILFYSMIVHEPYDSVNTISFAMLILILINPFWIFSISFQLSFIATISIIVLTPKIIEILYPFKGKTLTTLASILSVNIGLLPIQAYYFNSVSLLGIIANFITIPILSIALILGMIMLILNYILPFLNLLLGLLLNLLLNIESKIVDILYNFPLNTIKVLSPDIITIILYYVFIGMLFNLINIKQFNQRLRKTILFYMLILILANTMIISLDQSIQVHFIDVGQGDSILIETKKLKYLIDTGGSLFDNFDVGKSITLPYLQKIGINKLDGVIISHFDDDHSKGLDILIKNMKIKEILSSYIPEDKFRMLPMTVLKEKDLIILDENTKIEIIWPDSKYEISGLSSNNKSLVLLLTYKENQILFTGDIEKDVESKLLNKFEKPIQILKVAHHGSITSSNQEFIDKIFPKYSIISVGRNNFYNHPNKEVLDRLNNINSSIYRTDEMGLIKIVLNNKEIEIIPYLNTQMDRDKSIICFIRDNIYMFFFYLVYYISSYTLIMMYRKSEEELIFIEL